jgi:RNA polymerase sigma factor (sigma-70 family)
VIFGLQHLAAVVETRRFDPIAGEPDEDEVPSGLPPGASESLVEGVRQGEREALEELYKMFSRGIRFYLSRHLGPRDLEDRVHDTFLIVVQAIRRGEMRDSSRLLGFIRTVVRRQVATYIERSIQQRQDTILPERAGQIRSERHSPEEAVMTLESRALMEKLLASLDERDRDILIRFYIHEQSPEQICAEMGLTPNQFRLLKHRAKVRFTEMGRKKVAVPTFIGRIFSRKKAASAS